MLVEKLLTKSIHQNEGCPSLMPRAMAELPIAVAQATQEAETGRIMAQAWAKSSQDPISQPMAWAQ
jgi:hypothetical protein